MKIKDICKYGIKSKIKAGDGLEKGEFKFFTSSSVCNKYLDYAQFEEPGIIMGTGGNATLHYAEGDFSVSTDCVVLLPDSNVNCKYLYYYLKKNIKILEAGFKGAGLKHTSKKYIDEIDVIDIPDKSLQLEIVKTLDKVGSIIDNRLIQLNELDMLIKSQFVEMFGDNKYPIVKAQEICEFITKGTTPKSGDIIEEHQIGYVPYLKVYNLSLDGSLLFEYKPQYVKKEIHDNLLARSKVYPKDVLMNIVGPPLGKFTLIPDGFSECNVNQAIAIFRATEKVKPRFLLYALMQPETLRPFIDSAVGVRQQNLSLQQCRELEIPLPPIELQNQFATFVQQVDKLKFKIQESLDEAQTLFDSLMQKYFG